MSYFLNRMFYLWFLLLQCDEMDLETNAKYIDWRGPAELYWYSDIVFPLDVVAGTHFESFHAALSLGGNNYRTQ